MLYSQGNKDYREIFMRKGIKILSFFLIFGMLLTAVSCSYRAERSDKLEREVVFTLDEKYEVKYELYRFAFLTELFTISSHQNKDSWDELTQYKYFKQCDTAARKEVARVYALFALCEEYGIDPEGRKIDKIVKAGVKDAIKNKETGYGNRETYLNELAAANMNDSVFRLYLRYAACEEALAKAMHEANFVPEDAASVRAYYNGDETVRATWIYIPYEVFKGYTDEMLNNLSNQAKFASDEAFFKLTHQYYQTLYTDAELDTGFYFGKYQLDDSFDELTETAFALSEGKTSGIIQAGDGAYIVRRLAKDASYINDDKNLDYLRECYLLNEFYRTLDAKEGEFLNKLSPTAFYETLTLLDVEAPLR